MSSSSAAAFVVQPPRTMLVNANIGPTVVQLDSRGMDLSAGVTSFVVNVILVDKHGNTKEGLAGNASLSGAYATVTQDAMRASGSTSSGGAGAGASSSRNAPDTTEDPYRVFFPFADLSYHEPGTYTLTFQVLYFDGISYRWVVGGESRRFKIVQTEEEMVDSLYSGNERNILRQLGWGV